MIHARDDDGSASSIQYWSTDRADRWMDETRCFLTDQRGRTPLEHYKDEQFAIADTPLVAAGVKLDSGVVILTAGYLDYLSLIATHVAATVALRGIASGQSAGARSATAEQVSTALETLTRLQVSLALAHFEGRFDCSRTLELIDPLSAATQVRRRCANWILFTILHELGHLDLHRRGIRLPSQKEEMYCDAFALKGWESSAPLVGYVGDVMVLFTYQWPIDLRYRDGATHPPTFDRARAIVDAVNVDGAFDQLIGSLEGDFWSKGAALIGRDKEDRGKDLTILRSELDVAFRRYAEAANMVFQLADSASAFGGGQRRS